MKNLNKLFVACVVLAAMSSCRTFTYTSRVENIQNTEVKATTTLVDVRVDFNKRIVSESGKQKTEKQAKEEAKYNAIINNKIDVLVDPIFKVERKAGSSKPYKAYLTGFAGYYENPRTVTDEIKTLKDLDMKDIEKHVVMENPAILPLLKESENSGNVTVNNFGGCDGKQTCPASIGDKDAPASNKAAGNKGKNK